ncbi:LysM peptidoglycan-binding domain-containing protein [Pseudomonadales bacterium]|nr:LysM peptidoglycan-binding domain-containing protein [Pseudomonadales bacterium]
MQTLKTAAIVVLMMAVIYGAYVSMTKPPETLPEDVQGLLAVDEGLDIPFDSNLGLPESLGGGSVPGENLGAPLVNSESQQSIDSQPLGSRSSIDIPNDSLAVGAARATDRTKQLGSPVPLADVGNTIPPEASAATQADIASAYTNDRYPKTAGDFALPNPDNINPNFEPSGVALPNTGVGQSGGVATASAEGIVANGSDVATATAVIAPNVGLANAIRTADMQFRQDKRKDALATLSIFYNTPSISGEQRSEMLARLDPLAREVIYSKRHLLEQPHRMSRNETLQDVARAYDVPWQLLANINGIQDPLTILPGTELKVVRGPFRAEVNLTLKELTLFMGDYYAGRFPIAVGNDPIAVEGSYTIQDKQTGKTFYNRSGSPVAPGSPANPYGNFWMDLGNQLSIHGSPDPTRPNENGCISLAEDIADDLYGILSQGSSVTIRR